MKKLIFLIVALMLISSACYIDGQSINNVFKSTKSKIINRTNSKIDQGIDKGLDEVEKGAKDDSSGKENSQEASDQQAQQQEEGDDSSAGDSKQTTASLETYSKYDFIPGEKVIFFEDFSQDAVGDFPALWNTNGSAEVVTTNLFPGKWMRFVGDNAVWTDGLLKLPDNYTIELDVIPIKGEENGMAGYSVRLMQSINANSYDHGSVPGKAGFCYTIEYFGRPGYRSYINLEGGEGLGMSDYKDGDAYKQKMDNKYHIAIWVQKTRVRLYQDQNKIFDLPKAFNHPGIKMDRLRFESGAVMASNIRIAVGAPDTRNKLLTEGKLVTYGIYFDVNKDIVKPESYGTLKEISTVLNENPGIKVKIIGFTDSDGDDASNLDLSKRRSAAVKAELVRTFNVDGSRIETDGMGEGQPVAPNDTQVNKALNRRVEFIKL
jgi:OmpA-OmpF porin, OOP family